MSLKLRVGDQTSRHLQSFGRRGRVDELRRPHTAARRGRLPPGPRESARVDDRVPEASRRRPVPATMTPAAVRAARGGDIHILPLILNS